MFDGLFDNAFDAVYDKVMPSKHLPPASVPVNKTSEKFSAPPLYPTQQPLRSILKPAPRVSELHPVRLSFQPEPRNKQAYFIPKHHTYISQQQGRDPYNRPASTGRVDRYRPQSYGGQGDRRDRYNDDYYSDEYDDYDDRRSSRKDHKSSKSKSRKSRSRSRSGVRGKLEKSFDKSERGLTTGALGALAGGLVGHEVGKGPLATVAGVVLGGLGANAFEARHERGKEKEKEQSQSYKSKRSKSTDDRRRDYDRDDGYARGRGSQSRGRGGYDDDYDSYDDDRSVSPRKLTGAERKEKRREQRRKQEEQDEMEKHFTWGHTLSN